MDIVGSLESGSQVCQVSEDAQLGGIPGTFPRTLLVSFRNSLVFDFAFSILFRLLIHCYTHGMKQRWCIAVQQVEEGVSLYSWEGH